MCALTYTTKVEAKLFALYAVTCVCSSLKQRKQRTGRTESIQNTILYQRIVCCVCALTHRMSKGNRSPYPALPLVYVDGHIHTFKAYTQTQFTSTRAVPDENLNVWVHIRSQPFALHGVINANDLLEQNKKRKERKERTENRSLLVSNVCVCAYAVYTSPSCSLYMRFEAASTEKSSIFEKTCSVWLVANWMLFWAA